MASNRRALYKKHGIRTLDVLMIKNWQLMDYKDIGFRDDNCSNRTVASMPTSSYYSKKVGYQDFLAEMAQLYQVKSV